MELDKPTVNGMTVCVFHVGGGDTWIMRVTESGVQRHYMGEKKGGVTTLIQKVCCSGGRKKKKKKQTVLSHLNPTAESVFISPFERKVGKLREKVWGKAILLQQ